MAKKEIPIEVGSGNVFKDLGFRNPEYELLRAELVRRIVELLRRRRLSQIEAAKILGIDQPKISALINGRIGGFSAERLFQLLTRLGQDVRIVLSKKPARTRRGRLLVEAA